MRVKHLQLLCLAIVAGFYVVGLWPFRFSPENDVAWTPDGPGIRFGSRGMVYSPRPFTLNAAANPSDTAAAFSIEIYLQSESERARYVPQIVSLYDGQLPENLVIGQWKSILLLRAPIPERGLARRYREIGVEAALQRGRKRFIAISGDGSGTAIYIDGVLARHFPGYVLPPNLLAGQIVLGDAVEGGSAWRGSLYGLAIFSRSLNAVDVLNHYPAWTGHAANRLAAEPGLAALYLFDEGFGQSVNDLSSSRLPLSIPGRYRVLSKTVLSPPWRDFSSTASRLADAAVNVLGFMPFGFFFYLYRTRIRPDRRIFNMLLAVLLGSVVSASIELIQVFLPGRSSSLTDLILNALGTALGLLLVPALAALRGSR